MLDLDAVRTFSAAYASKDAALSALSGVAWLAEARMTYDERRKRDARKGQRHRDRVRDGGAKSDPAMLLIMGLGAQLTLWSDAFCEGLAATGFLTSCASTIATCGLSTDFDSWGQCPTCRRRS